MMTFSFLFISDFSNDFTSFQKILHHSHMDVGVILALFDRKMDGVLYSSIGREASKPTESRMGKQ